MIFQYQITQADGITIFDFQGKLLLESDLNLLQEALIEQLEKGSKNFIYDFNKLSHINSTGLNFLIRSLTKIRIEGGDLYICHIKKDVHQIFEISKLNEVFTIYNNKEEAIKHFKK